MRAASAASTPAELAGRDGTPFYAYDLDVVGRQVDALRRRLPSSVDLAYAVKANPSLAVLRRLAGLGLGADVASGGELRQALRAGFVAGEVVVTGPGKRDEELAAAVDAGRARGDGGVRRRAPTAGDESPRAWGGRSRCCSGPP